MERYRAIYQAAAAKGARLVNTPAQYQTAMEFDKFYPLLGDLTPESLVLSSVDLLATVEEQLGFPVFVKGAVKSNKDQGWAACVAQNSTELAAIAPSLLARERRSRGKIIARRLVRFRNIATDAQSFPIGREYRVFVHRDEVLVYGFYWGRIPRQRPAHAGRRCGDPCALDRGGARGIGTPFIAADIGQLEDGRWIVIEVSDGQFAGLSHVKVMELWSKLAGIRWQALRRGDAGLTARAGRGRDRRLPAPGRAPARRRCRRARCGRTPAHSRGRRPSAPAPPSGRPAGW